MATAELYQSNGVVTNATTIEVQADAVAQDATNGYKDIAVADFTVVDQVISLPLVRAANGAIRAVTGVLLTANSNVVRITATALAAADSITFTAEGKK